MDIFSERKTGVLKLENFCFREPFDIVDKRPGFWTKTKIEYGKKCSKSKEWQEIRMYIERVSQNGPDCLGKRRYVPVRSSDINIIIGWNWHRNGYVKKWFEVKMLQNGTWPQLFAFLSEFFRGDIVALHFFVEGGFTDFEFFCGLRYVTPAWF